MRVKVIPKEQSLPGDLESRSKFIHNTISLSTCKSRDVTLPAYIEKRFLTSWCLPSEWVVDMNPCPQTQVRTKCNLIHISFIATLSSQGILFLSLLDSPLLPGAAPDSGVQKGEGPWLWDLRSHQHPTTQAPSGLWQPAVLSWSHTV